MNNTQYKELSLQEMESIEYTMQQAITRLNRLELEYTQSNPNDKEYQTKINKERRAFKKINNEYNGIKNNYIQQNTPANLRIKLQHDAIT